MTLSPGRGGGASSSPGTRNSRSRGNLRARRSIKICSSLTLDPFQAPRWLPAAPSSAMEVSEAVAAEKKEEEEEEEEADGGECGARREPRPPIAAEAVNNKQGRPAADLSGARGCGGEEDGGGGKR